MHCMDVITRVYASSGAASYNLYVLPLWNSLPPTPLHPSELILIAAELMASSRVYYLGSAVDDLAISWDVFWGFHLDPRGGDSWVHRLWHAG